MRKEIKIYCDGACAQNSSWEGGWGVVILGENGGIAKKFSGYSKKTTNSRMEIQAMLEGLKYLKKPSKVTIYSDSQYVCKTINEWLDGWLKKGTFKEKANTDQWEEFIELRKIHDVEAQHVRGHRGNYYNEIVDSLAYKASKGEVVSV